MTHLITYSEDTFLCDRELGDFISFLFFGFFFFFRGGEDVTHIRLWGFYLHRL